MTDLSIPISLAAFIFFGVAFLYSSVGLGGGSSYTALLAVLGASTQMIPTVSLSLNILVTTIGSTVFLYKGYGRIRLIGPFLDNLNSHGVYRRIIHYPKDHFLYPAFDFTLSCCLAYLPAKSSVYYLNG